MLETMLTCTKVPNKGGLGLNELACSIGPACSIASTTSFFVSSHSEEIIEKGVENGRRLKKL